jgi:hypothetical protein
MLPFHRIMRCGSSFALAAVAAGLLGTGHAVAQETAVPTAELDTLLAQHTHAIKVDGRNISGPGVDWLRSQAAAANFFLFGEQHATADIALFAAGLFEQVHDLGYEVAAVELGRRETPLMEAMMRQDGGETFARYAGEPAHRMAFAFFSWKEEAEFALTVLRLSKRTSNAIWGLDQEFVLGGPVLVAELARLATTDAQRAAVDAARQAVAQDPAALGAGEDAPWQRLDQAFAGNPQGSAITAGILVSRRIYKPFTGGGGSAYLANDERERLMKTNLHAQLMAARKESGGWPKVFMKFGANHVGYGHSPTHVLSLGTFVHEIATAHGGTSFNLMVDCAGGEGTSPQTGAPERCESELLDADSDLGRYVGRDAPTLIDLRPLRSNRRLWKDWDVVSKRLIDAYDAYLALPNVKPATWISSGTAAVEGAH